MLRVKIAALHRRPVDISGKLESDDPLFEDFGYELSEPVLVTGRISSAGLGRFYWRGEIVTSLEACCRRCLARTRLPIAAQVNVMFTEDQDGADPSEYVVPERGQVLELHQAVREELILAIPEYVVCREKCKGLCAVCGTDLNVGSCSCQPPTDPRWGALEALKTKTSE